MDHTDSGEPTTPRADVTRWSDAASRETLQQLVDSVTELAGFAVAVINVVRGDTMTTVTVSSNHPEVQAQLLGAETPFALIEAEMDRAEHIGRLRFVADEDTADREMSSWSWRTDTPPLDRPDAWLPDYLLFAPLHAADGSLIGLLSTDLPVDGLRPTPARYALLEQYVEHAEHALRSALRRDEVAQQVRLTETARHLVRAASSHPTLEKVLEQSRAPLTEGFGALGTWIQVFDVHGLERGEAVLANGSTMEIPTDLVAVAQRAAHTLWDEQNAAITGLSYPDHPVITPEDRDRVHAFLDSAGIDSTLFVPLGAGPDVFGILVLARWPDDPRWSEVEARGAMDVGRDLGAAILNARAFERQRRLMGELQNLDAYKSQLIATVSHELKSPLTAIMANLDLLTMTDEVPGSARESVAAMSRGAARLAGLIDDLLLLARVDGHSGRRLDEIDVGEVTSTIVDRLEPHTSARITLVAQAGLLVAGDGDELDRLISTLLTNAVTYGGRRVEVSVQQRADEVVVTVTDDGWGITAEDLPRVFDEFFRSHDPRVLEQPGAGLGLSIAARIAERHGGTVIAQSAAELGSTFSVRLPGTGTTPPPSVAP